MYPILARTEFGFIYTFSVIWIIGIGLSALACVRHGNAAKRVIDVFLAVGAAGLLAGRAVFVWLNWDYFGENSAEIIAFTQGGIAYAGVLLGTALTYILLQFTTQLKLSVPITAIGLLFLSGWLACYADGCAHGLAASPSALTAPLPDTFGVITHRYRTQLLGILLTLAAWALVRAARIAVHHKPAILLMLLCSIHLATRPLRGDTMHTLGGFSADAIANGSIIVACCLLIAVNQISKNNHGPNS